MTVTEKKRDKALEALKSYQKISVDVGIHDEGLIDPESGTPMGQIASAHEFGIGVPQRSFIRRCADEDAEVHRSRISKLMLQGAVKGTDAAVVAKRIALALQTDFQKFIADGRVTPALDPDGPTVKRKGSDVPLKDRGTLQASIRGKATVGE